MELNELLNKVSEEDLAKAVGGLTQRNKNLLIGAVALLAGTAVGVGGKLAYDKWGSKDPWKDFKWDDAWYKKGDEIQLGEGETPADFGKKLFTHLPEDTAEKQAAYVKTNLGLEVTFDEDGNIADVKKVK